MADRLETILIFIIVCTGLLLILHLGLEDMGYRFSSPSSYPLWPSSKHNPTLLQTTQSSINKCFGPECHNPPTSQSTIPPKQATFKPLTQHSKKSGFLHPSIHLQFFSEFKGHGIVTKEPIPFGTVLAIEYPIFRIIDEDKFNNLQLENVMHFIHDSIKKTAESDPEFKRIWENEIRANPAHLRRQSELLQSQFNVDVTSPENVAALKDSIKYFNNHYGEIIARKPWAIYYTLSKINFGLPQNVAAIFGNKADGYPLVLITTKDIEHGEELMMDYFFDWKLHNPVAKYRLVGKTQKLMDMGLVFDGQMMEWHKILTSTDVSAKDKAIVLRKIYANGIVGKAADSNKMDVLPGQGSLTDEQYEMKKQIIESVNNGALFDWVAKRSGYAPKWMQKQYETLRAKMWQDQRHWQMAKGVVDEGTARTWDIAIQQCQATTRGKWQHSRKTKFVFPSLKLHCFDPNKAHGIITTTKIRFGTILAVDYPILTVADREKFGEAVKESIAHTVAVMDKIVQDTIKEDPEFLSIWENLALNTQEFTRIKNDLRIYGIDPEDKHVLASAANLGVFWTNHYGQIAAREPLAIYSVLSKINFGLPQNVAAIFGSKDQGYPCVLVATRDIEINEELVMDYFLDWRQKASLDARWRKIKSADFGYILDDAGLEVTRKLTSADVSAKDKANIMRKIYSNGIVGKKPDDKYLDALPGRGDLNDAEFAIKKGLIGDVNSGEFFDKVFHAKGFIDQVNEYLEHTQN